MVWTSINAVGELPLGGPPRRSICRRSAMSRKLAFTLVELLVVIAIIGVLVALSCRPCNRPAKRREE